MEKLMPVILYPTVRPNMVVWARSQRILAEIKDKDNKTQGMIGYGGYGGIKVSRNPWVVWVHHTMCTVLAWESVRS